MNATIADVLRYGFAHYVAQFGRQPVEVLKVVDAIIACRTETLGGHRYKCERCGTEVTLHNSCRNRNCPQCQAAARLCWVHDRIDDLLPVGYFHAVLTIPDSLSAFAIRNKAAFYPLMFRAAQETLLTLSRDPKRLGAGVGFIAVLHTWGQTLIDHPHLHIIIPGGGLTSSGSWKACQNNFLFPVPVLRKMFRGKLLEFFSQAVASGDIEFHGQLDRYKEESAFKELLNELYRKEWVVYVKPPFASPQAVVNYLGQYTHRIAIANSRIERFEKGMVTFTYKDYADGCKRKLMTLGCVEFIRRFLLHVVPKGFVRIRHYGFLANRNRQSKLAKCREFFHKQPPRKRFGKRTSFIEAFKERFGYDPRRCKLCCNGIMLIAAVIPPLGVAVIT